LAAWQLTFFCLYFVCGYLAKVIACVCVVGTDYAEQCALPEMSDQADESDCSNPDSDATNVTENQQQSVTVTDASVAEADPNFGSADNEQPASVADSSSDGHQDVCPAVTDHAVQLVGTSASQLTSVISTTVNACQSLGSLPAASSTGISLAAKSQTFILCEVTSGGQTILVPQSAVSGIQLSSGTSAVSAGSIARVPLIRSAIPLRTVSSDSPATGIGIVSPAAAAVAVTRTSAGVLLRPAANGVQVIAGTSSLANRAGAGVMLNRGTTPQRLAVAIAPANSTLRPTGIGSVRLVAIRNGTPLAVGGVRASGSTVALPQLKLLTSAVPLSGVRPLTSVSTAATTVTSSVQAPTSTVTAVRQQTAVNDVQAYLRRIEELKSSQPEQGTKSPVTLTTTVRTPLKAKTVLPSLTSAQQIVVVQSGSQPQLAAQLVSIFVTCYCMLLPVLCLFRVGDC